MINTTKKWWLETRCERDSNSGDLGESLYVMVGVSKSNLPKMHREF